MKKKLKPATKTTRAIRVDPGLFKYLKSKKRPKETMAQCVRRLVEEAVAKAEGASSVHPPALWRQRLR